MISSTLFRWIVLSSSTTFASELKETAFGRQAKTAVLGDRSDMDILARLLGDNIEPLPNDTISAAYWTRVNDAIAEARRNTPPPPTEPPSNNTNQWENVFGASQTQDVTARDLTPEEIANGEVVGGAVNPSPASQEGLDGSAERSKKVALVPYDMQIGARIMNGLTAQATVSPPPSQQMVSQQFVAQCPMVMFGDSMQIRAPTCGNGLGTWNDPASGRAVMRWDPLFTGGIRFGVDSVVGGNGTATFANIKQQMSMQGNFFELSNCLGVVRYTVEEKVVKINHMGRGVISTITEHDISQSREAYFYKYLIRHPNGSTVAQTGLFRLNQDEVNITMLNDEVSDGAMVARAKKVGSWNADGWRKCSKTKREWTLDFMLGQRDVEMVATVMDLRVASAAIITLMAFREETIGAEDGINRTGEHNMLREILWATFFLLLASVLLLLCIMVGRWRRWDMKAYRFCFKLEAALLPKRPAKMRLPQYNTTY